MPKSTKLIGLVLVVVCSGLVIADEEKDLLKVCIETQKKIEKIRQESYKATAAENQRMSVISSMKYSLRNGITDDVKDRCKKNIENNLKQIEYFKAQIKKDKALLEMANLSKDEQKAKSQELDQEMKVLGGELRAKSKPFNDRVSAINQETSDQVKRFGEILKKYFRVSAEFPEIAEVSLHPSFSGVISVNWKDAGGKRLIWSHVRIIEKPMTNPSAKKLAGKYEIMSSGASQVWLYAGKFQLAFVSSSKKYNKKETILKAVQALVDLEKLAAMSAK